MQMVPLVGFAPDLPPTAPGVMTACENVLPTESGFEGGPSGVAVTGVAALASACRGAAVVAKIDGTRRTFAGTATRLYELVNSAWTDVSRGAFYTGGADARWSFAQFGSTTLASNDTEIVQASTGAAFADVTGAPKAKVIFTVGDFVMALNTNDATYGDQGDRWWCSGIFDHTAWTPSVSTQANTGRLVQGGGEIVAGLALGRQAVAYKPRAMFIGTYVGGAAVWQWDQVHGEQGACGQDAVCDADGVHVFVGDDDIWVYDGARPRPVGDGVRQWFFNNSSPSHRYRTTLVYERQRSRVWIFFADTTSSSGALNRAIVYHMKTGRWGVRSIDIEAALQYVQAGTTIDGLSGLSGTMDGLPEIPWDSQFWLAAGRAVAYFDLAHAPKTLTGASASSSFTTGEIGDDQGASFVSEVRLRYSLAPAAGALAGQRLSVSGGAPSAGASASLFDGAYHARQQARWHKFAITHTGPVAFNALGVDVVVGGER